MMQAVGFDYVDLEPYPVELSLNSAEDVAELRTKRMPAIYVLEGKELTKLRQFDSVIVDRGRKHPSRTLSSYLLGMSKIPTVKADYVAAGRVINALHKLIKQSQEKDDQNIYILGVSTALMKELLVQAGSHEQDGGNSGDGNDSLSGDKYSGGDDLFSYSDRRLIGVSRQINDLRSRIKDVADQDASVLIEGESGTGKNLVARSIHECGNRRGEPFIALNVAALPRERIEAELFGWVKGSFPNALYDKKGMWVVAGRGTLVLDEIGDFDPDLQKKLLTVVEEGVLLPVGATRQVKVHARVIACTNRDLAAKVADGSFSEPLYWRLFPFQLRTPSLRERPEDIGPIAQHLWKQITGGNGSNLDENILNQLRCQAWPGNIRELEAVLRRLYVYYKKGRPDSDDLATILRLHTSVVSPAQSKNARRGPEDMRVDCLNHLHRVDQIVRSIKIAFRPISSTRKKWGVGDAGANLYESPEGLVEYAVAQEERQLDLLCEQPLLFYDQLVFKEVYHLKGMLLYLLGLLRKNGRGAKAFYQKELKPQLELVTELLFRTMRELLAAT